MLSVIKQIFIVLLSFSSTLASVAKISYRTKCQFLNNKPCMVRLIMIDLSPVELKYYPLLVSLDNCNGSCNDLSPKICVPSKTKT